MHNIDETIKKLRHTADEIRRKPYPISDIIPLLQKAADDMEWLNELLNERERELSNND